MKRRRAPDWPMRMRQDTAAAFLDMEREEFMAKVATCVAPIDARPAAWDRRDLEAWLDAQHAGGDRADVDSVMRHLDGLAQNPRPA